MTVRRKYGSRVLCAPSATVSLASGVMIALAGAPASGTTPVASEIQEVVVTAAKRSEPLQEVPLSITALTSDVLERSGVATFTDYAQMVPNLTFASGHGIAEGRQIALRGVQGVGTTGFYIDEMSVPSTIDARVVDLQRIEVLRGPQGTLYGARSMGGTMRLITAVPDPTAFSAKVHASGAEIEGGGGSYQVDGTVNAPLGEHVAIRLTGYDGRDGAYIVRRFPTSPGAATRTAVDVGQNDFAGGIASLIWQVTDAFSVRPTVLYQKSKQNGLPLADVSPGTLLQDRLLNVPERVDDEWTYGGLTLKYVTPVGDLTSVSSWFSRQSYEREDASDIISLVFGSPLLPATFETWQPRHSFVQEVRYTSALSGPLQLTAGVFLQREKTNYDQYSEAPGLNAAFGGALGSDLVYDLWRPQERKEDAAFGELTYHLSPHWSILGGLRYSKIQTYSNEVQSGPAAGGFAGGEARSAESKTTPKIVLKFEPNGDTNLYALAAQGFRPGAAQIPPPPTFCAADYARLGVTFDELQAYKADSLWNFEVGAKMQLADRRVRLNTALFWIDWSDLQQSVIMSGCGYGYRANVGKARSRGAEFELTASLTERLLVGVGIGYTDAKITQSSSLVPAKVGDPVQQIAPLTVSASLDYSIPLSARVKGVAHLDGAFVDKSYSASNDTATPRVRDAYTIVNLRAGAEAGPWSLTAFVRNLTNEHANLGDNQSQAAELPGRPRWLVNAPRTYGVEATYHW